MNAAAKARLLSILKVRFEETPQRHKGIKWTAVQAKLEVSSGSLDALHAMEQTGGEPDVIAYDKGADSFTYCDCAAESPAGRRSICYDRSALDARKKNKPSGNAIDTATSLGIELLTEAQYRTLQTLGEFDTKTSSWIKTPSNVRELGGALFCDRRYGQVFVYHNGADSYYAARGFRGQINV